MPMSLEKKEVIMILNAMRDLFHTAYLRYRVRIATWYEADFHNQFFMVQTNII